MRSRLCFIVLIAFVVTGNILAVQPVLAQSFSFTAGGFTSTNVCANSSTPAAGCQVLTNGSPTRPQVVTGGVLRLTTANQNQHGSAWFATAQPVTTGFTTAFQFRFTNAGACPNCGSPADGLALVIQNDPVGTAALGYTGNGQNMSYGNNDVSTASGVGSAILNSMAIELDTYKNSDYTDPDANHIAVQSCGPNNSTVLSPNSADHNYTCADGKLAKLALQSLPAGMSLSDGNTHTITVNYLPPGNCTSACNNLSVYFDSTLILQATLDITKQLSLPNGSAYLGFTSATGAAVENNDVVSWSFSQWPLAPITIIQPLQPTVTTFNYTANLSATTDYSGSGLAASAFSGIFMQGSVSTITDQQYSDLVQNTPFQGSICQRQDTGNGSFACVVTTDLCTTPTSSVPAGANCLGTTNPLIGVSNTYDLDPLQKPIIAPGYFMGKDSALSCAPTDDNTCKGLTSVFTDINGDGVTTKGKTNNFNSILVPNLGVVTPQTSVTTTPQLNSGWTNGSFSVNFNAIESVPTINHNPPSPLPTVTSINYTASGDNLPSPVSGAVTGPTGSINVPVTKEGVTTIAYSATDSNNNIETLITSDSTTVSTSTPIYTIHVDLTAPTVSCQAPAPVWQATDAVVTCSASDNANGSGLVGPSSFAVTTAVTAGTETNTATIPPVTVHDVAGNTSAPQPAQGSFGPFMVDKKPPAITGPTISPSSPVSGQSVSASFSCADGGSGVVLCGPSGSAQIPATANTGVINLAVDSSVGTHLFMVSSQDLVGHFTSASVTYTVSAGKITPVITWPTPAPITYGTRLCTTQLNATANVPGTLVYSPPSGTLLAAGVHTLSVTFTPTDTTHYTTASASVQLVVFQKATVVVWAKPAAIPYGTALSSKQLNAKASVPGTLVYTPPAGTVLQPGTQVLSVAFTPTDSVNYLPGSAQVAILVTQPLISFSPAVIDFGTVKVGSTPSVTVVVSNPGTATLKVSSIALAPGNPDNAYFAITNFCGSGIAPGRTATFKVKLSATVAKTFALTVLVTDNVTGSPQSIPLTATVVGP